MFFLLVCIRVLDLDYPFDPEQEYCRVDELVGSRIHPEQLGGRLWISQAPRFSAILESE